MNTTTMIPRLSRAITEDISFTLATFLATVGAYLGLLLT